MVQVSLSADKVGRTPTSTPPVEGAGESLAATTPATAGELAMSRIPLLGVVVSTRRVGAGVCRISVGVGK
jgi:hypothetical protein